MDSQNVPSKLILGEENTHRLEQLVQNELDLKWDWKQLKTELSSQVVTNEFLRVVSDEIDNGLKDGIAPFLAGLSKNDVAWQGIKTSYQLLSKWKKKLQQEATYFRLVNAFSRSGNKRLVELSIKVFQLRLLSVFPSAAAAQNIASPDHNITKTGSLLKTVENIAVTAVEAQMSGWYRPSLSREDAKLFLKYLEPGAFVVRKSHTYYGSYVVTMRLKPGEGDDGYMHIIKKPDSTRLHLQSNQESGFDTTLKHIADHTMDANGLPYRLILPDEFQDPASKENSVEDAESEEESSKKLLQEAMESGYVLSKSIVLLLIGAAGSGKSSFARFVLKQPLPENRESTGLADSSIRALSVSRAAVGEEGNSWNAVTPDMLLGMLANSIKGGVSSKFAELLAPIIKKAGESNDPDPELDASEDTPEDASTAAVSSSQDNEDSTAKKYPKPHYDTFDELEKKRKRKLELAQSTLFQAKVIQQIISLIGNSKESGLLFEDEMVYLVDSGGQPQYHELLPTFVHHASGAGFCFKLNEKLSSRPMIEYYGKEGKMCGKPYQSMFTHEQILLNCLQVMQSRESVSGETECPSLFMIGTHSDLADKCSESIRDKNVKLLDILLQNDQFRDYISFYRLSKPEQVLYPVNSKSPGQHDQLVAEEFRKAVMKHCRVNEDKIPIAWFILEQLILQLSKEKGTWVLSFTECQQVAYSLLMDRAQLRAALFHLTRLNVFMFLPRVLPRVVFSTAQVLLDKLSELVEFSHSLRTESDETTTTAQVGRQGKFLQFRNYGLIDLKLLQEFPKHYIEDLFTPHDLLKIWMKLLVIAKSSDGNYFLPCVLSESPDEILSSSRIDLATSSLSSLLIHYPGRWFPSGIFTSLISYLQNKSQWRIMQKSGQPLCLYKNCVKFKSVALPVNFTLIYSFQYLELHAKIPKELHTEICPRLYKTILSGLAEAAKVQKYERMNPKPAVLCPSKDSGECASSFHLATVSPDWLWWSCSKEEEVGGKLADKHLLWKDAIKDADSKSRVEAIKSYSSVQLLDEKEVPLLSDKPKLHSLQLLQIKDKSFEIMEIVASKWEQLALGFEFEPFRIKNISRDNPKCMDACRSMFQQWLDEKACKDITWQQLAHVLSTSDFIVLAQELTTALTNQ